MSDMIDKAQETHEKRTETHACDCVSRQAAIDAILAVTGNSSVRELYEHVQEHGLSNMWSGGVNAAIDTIIAVPSAEPEQRWIPVSERLPEDEYVLISKLPTKISGSKWSVAIAIRTADPRSGKIQWRDSGFGVMQDDKVLAWMPLPEPYQAERREE